MPGTARFEEKAIDYPRTKMALITSDCDAMRPHPHQMALITSNCVARFETARPLTGRMVAASFEHEPAPSVVASL